MEEVIAGIRRNPERDTWDNVTECVDDLEIIQKCGRELLWSV